VRADDRRLPLQHCASPLHALALFRFEQLELGERSPILLVMGVFRTATSGTENE